MTILGPNGEIVSLAGAGSSSRSGGPSGSNESRDLHSRDDVDFRI
jgi:hypothetical protein